MGGDEKSEYDKLSQDLHLARTEVDRLLKIVATTEAEKDRLASRLKDVNR